MCILIKKYTGFILVLVLLLTITACKNSGENKIENTENQKSNMDKMQDMQLAKEILDYTKAIKTFVDLQADEVQNKIVDEEMFFLYTGRVTCQWCRKLVPVLKEIAQQLEIEIIYLDSQMTESDAALKKLRERYNIESVPSIIFFYRNGLYENINIDITSDKFGQDSLKEVLTPYIDKIGQ